MNRKSVKKPQPSAIFSVIVCASLLATSFAFGQAPAKQPPAEPRSEAMASSASFSSITPESVRPVIGQLSGDEMEGRGAGYPGERKAAEIIAAEFKKIGLQPAGDMNGKQRSYFQEFKFQPRHPVTPWETLTSRNVLGFIEGSDPALKQEIVVIGAHYDGQGKLGQADPMRFYPKESGSDSHAVWNSANDNITGVSAVLAAARAIKQGHIETKRSILFIAFGCEEHGMSGSIQYVTAPAFPLERHVAMINYEKLGRVPDKPLKAQATGTSPAWAEVIQKASTLTGTQVKPLVPYVIPDSDHYPFAASNIPAVVFSAGGQGDDAHQTSDTADKIDYGRVAEFARFGLAVVLELANRPTRILYVDMRGMDPGVIAHLVSDEEADKAGLKAPASGLKVTGVIPGGPAARAGLKTGDLMLSTAGTMLRRDMTLESLQKMQMEVMMGQRGTHLPITVLRDGKQLELTFDLPIPPGMPGGR